jgi:hypothetical protein
MKQPRRIACVLASGALLVCALVQPPAAQAQSDLLPPPNTLAPAAAPKASAAPVAFVDRTADDAAVAALLAEVIQQQAKLTENQKVIDEKLAIIAENLRIARIYVSRAK